MQKIILFFRKNFKIISTILNNNKETITSQMYQYIQLIEIISQCLNRNIKMLILLINCVSLYKYLI